MTRQYLPGGPSSATGNSLSGARVAVGAPLVAHTAALAVLPLEEAAAVDARTGTGTLAATASPAGSGTKKTASTGTIAGSTGFTNAGSKATSGTGSLAPSAGFTVSATRATGGTGTLALLTTIDSAATPARAGAASLALAPTLAASGDKAESSPDRTGTGTLALAVSLTGTGLSSEQPVVPEPASWGRAGRLPLDAFADPEHREGSGVISLHARLAAEGFKSFESDDELVLALAA